MRRALLVALALLATSCVSPRLPPLASGAAAPGPPPTAPQEGAACRTGPEGEAPSAAPVASQAAAPAALRTADRGIGGTGIRPDGATQTQVADRGIGGTGIVGVVTGFASLCLGGREVAFDERVPVLLDDAPATAAVLRAGQFTAVEAAGAPGALAARRIMVRHEVSGPVEEVGADGMLRVAGQRVRVTARTWGVRAPALGNWIAVSGLRMPDGEIEATRLDPRQPGPMLVHGPLRLEGGRLRIGALEIRPDGGVPVPVGVEVTATGRYGDGVLYADDIRPDRLLLDPAAYFGPAVSLFVVEGYAVFDGERLRLGPGLELRAPAGLGGGAPLRAVAEFERRTDGTLAVIGLHEAAGRLPGAGLRGRDMLAPGAAPRFETAPTPNRGRGLGLGRRFEGRGDGPSRRQGSGRGRNDASTYGGPQDGSGAGAFSPGSATGGGGTAAPGQGAAPGDMGFRRR